MDKIDTFPHSAGHLEDSTQYPSNSPLIPVPKRMELHVGSFLSRRA